MTKKLLIRKMHRYLALIVGIQLLLWSVGGLFFSIIPITEIRGDHLKAERIEVDWAQAENVKGIQEIYTAITHQGYKVKEISRINLEPIRGKFYYQIKLTEKRQIWVDAISGEVKNKYSKSEIKEIAQSNAKKNAGDVIDIQWITETPKASEYRGKSLPAYKIIFSGSENLHMYLDGYTGKINSMRTSNWRIFDFLWMLHVMDYDSRDDFNHLLLQFFALLAVVTSFSGLVLWGVSYRRKPRAA